MLQIAVFSQELAGLLDRALNEMLSGRGNIRLACDKLWDDTQWLEGWGASACCPEACWGH